MKKHRTNAVRITVLFILFFLFTIVTFFSGSFSKQMLVRNRDRAGTENDPRFKGWAYSSLYYGARIKPIYENYNRIVSSPSSDTTVAALLRPVSVDMIINSKNSDRFVKSSWATVMNVLILSTMLGGFVVLFAMLLSIAMSVKRKKVFSRSNIICVRILAALVAVYAVLDCLNRWLSTRQAAEVLESSGYVVDTSFSVNPFIFYNSNGHSCFHSGRSIFDRLRP